MAVIQISKIQVRRGQKNSNSGIPQLSSAEFAWAIDTQELYIGNGSVAEGAPYVGNTKILTEHDNILSLANSYIFAEDDLSIVNATSRSLQSKLDEYVSVLDYGAVGDGATDCTAAFEAAFEDLFKNIDDKYKKVLLVPNGTYLFLSTLHIPSTAILSGERRDGSILRIDANNIEFVTVDGLDSSLFDSTNRPTDIEISNLTISRTTGQVNLTGVKDSSFKNVRFLGDYVLGDPVASLTTESAALYWQNDLYGTATTGILFDVCHFDSNSVSIRTDQLDRYATDVVFQNCNFFINDTSIYITGVDGQKNLWKITDTVFNEIANQAFRSTAGTGTRFFQSEFKNCGNGTNSATSPTSPIVYFGEKGGNVLINCTSDRQYLGVVSETGTSVMLPEAYNSDRSSFIDRNYATIEVTDSFRPIAVLAAANKYTILDYTLILGEYSRVGQLTLVLGDVLLNVDDDITGSNISLSDNYQYSTPLISSTGGATMTNFEFRAVLSDNDSDSGFETIVLSYKNPLSDGVAGKLSFNITYGV